MPNMSSMTALDGTVIHFKDAVARKSTVEYIKSTQGGPTNLWTGISEDDSLYDGKQIAFYLSFAGLANPTLNLTLSTGESTGPKNILRNGLSAIDYGIPENSVIHLTWLADHDVWAVESKTGSDVVSYEDLSDKPKIESVTLQGDKSFEQLGLQTLTNSEIEAILRM